MKFKILKKYSDFKDNFTSQNIGLFIRHYDGCSYDEYSFLRFICPFALLNYDNEFNFYIVPDSEEQHIKEDLNNDLFKLDVVIIQDDVLSFDFAKTLIEKCKLFGISIIYDISHNYFQKIFYNSLTEDLEKVNCTNFIIENSNICIVDNFNFKNDLLLINKHVVYVPSILLNSINKQKLFSQNDIPSIFHNIDQESLNDIVDNWRDLLIVNKRDKTSCLYNLLEKFHKMNFNGSFIQYLVSKSYDIIKNSNLFDSEWYLLNYEDINYLNLDPIYHYINFGVVELCNPSKSFCTEEYINSGMYYFKELNPFVHYILYNNFPNYYFSILDYNYEKNYKIIEKSNLFDYDWYLSNNEDIKNSKFKSDPLKHYILHGFSESKSTRNPNPFFSNNFYRTNYLNRNVNINPLIHYILFGKNKGYKSNIFDFSSFEYSDEKINLILNKLDDVITVIIPIFGSYNVTKNCISSLINNTNVKLKIIIIPYLLTSEIKDYLNFVSKNNNIVILSKDFNLDEVIQKYIKKSKTDVLLLNSYVELPNYCLENLIIKAYSDDNIGAVTPLSNSIFNFYADYLPNDYKLFTVNGLFNLINKSSNNISIEMPFFDSFCMFIKQDSAKTFNLDLNSFSKDGVVFGMNFSCEKINILDDSTFIYHNLQFFDDNNNLIKNHENNNLNLFNDFLNSNAIKNLVFNNIHAMSEYKINNAVINRVLCLVDEKDIQFCNNFFNYFNNENHDFYYLVASQDILKLYHGEILIKEFKGNFLFNSYRNSNLKNIYFEILRGLKINLIHVDAFYNFSFDLMDIANIMNIPILFNDDFAGTVNQSNGYELIFDTIDSKYKMHFFKNLSEYQDLFNKINLFIVSNDNFKRLYTSIFDFSNCDIEIIDKFKFKNKYNIFSNFNNQEPIKIFLPGTLSKRYIDNITNLKSLDYDNKLEFHFLGNNNNLDNLGIHHGDFSISKFFDLINDFSFGFIGIWDIFPEIFQVLSQVPKILVPIIIYENKMLFDYFEGIPNLSVIPNDSYECSYNFIIELFEDNYFELLKNNIYHINNDVIEEISLINYKYENLYLRFVENYQKIKFNGFSYLDNYSNKLAFTDFEELLVKSYISPLIKKPFTYEDKRCFAFMDHISKCFCKKTNIGSDKLISIIFPVYNCIGNIEKVLGSVFNQSYSNYELLIVDDGSYDGTYDFLKSLNNSKIKLIHNGFHKGFAKSCNQAISIANGEYIFYLDTNTRWDCKYLETMLSVFINVENADALYSGQLLYDSVDNFNLLGVNFNSFNKSLLRNKNLISISSFAHKKSIFEKVRGFDESLGGLIEWDFILKINNLFKIHSVPVLLSKYFVNNLDKEINNFLEYNTNFKKGIINKNPIKSKNLTLNRKVSVIIPSFESLNDLQECINSVITLNLEEYVEIIVVDNNSNNAVKKYLKNLQQDNLIKLIQNDVNYAFTYAVNQGIEYSDPDSDILLLNNDAVLTRGVIESLQYYAYNLENCAITVPQEVVSGGAPSINAHVPFADPSIECNVTPSILSKNVINIPLIHNDEILEVNFAPFFCTYIKRDILNNSCGLDAELGRHHRSDRIFSNYVRHVLNSKIYCINDAIVYHKIQKATKRLKKVDVDDSEYKYIVQKNQWQPELAKKLGYKTPLWDK